MKIVWGFIKEHLPKIIFGIMMFLLTVTVIKLYKAWNKR